MPKQILVDAVCNDEIRVISIQDNKIIQFEQESIIKKRLKGNVYIGLITRIEPSLQAAFVEYGADKQGFLAFSDIITDYFCLSSEKKQNIFDHSSEDLHKSFNIQDVINIGQEILVQVIKEERGNKGVSLTTQITLASRYCILTPYSINRHIARSINDEKERARIAKALESIKSPVPGLIVRHFASGKNENNIYHDYEYLCKLWDDLQDKFSKSQAPSLLYTQGGIINKILCDYNDNNTSSIIVDGSAYHQQIKEQAKKIMPHEKLSIRLYRRKLPIFDHYNVETQIADLYNSRVSLPSGGYMIINPTEALVSIDINSGKMTNGNNIEETAYRTNLEAAYELAKQVELRGLSGLIVIDFIDMTKNKNCKLIKAAVESAFDEFNSYVQIGDIGAFGLMSLSKQRTKKSIFEFGTHLCSRCSGSGYTHSEESIFLKILRALYHQPSNSHVQVHTSEEVAMYIFNERYKRIEEIEDEFSLKISIIIDCKLKHDQFSINNIKLSKDHSKSKSNISDSKNNENDSWFKRWLNRFL